MTVKDIILESSLKALMLKLHPNETENNKRKPVLCILTVVLIFFCYKQIIHAAMNAFKFTFEKQIYNNYKMPYIYIIIMLM